jgi:hypothetical protein
MVTVPVRLAVPVFSVTLTVTVPVPVPLLGFRLTHVRLSKVVQAQSGLDAVTVTACEPALEVKFLLPGEML